MGGGGGEHHTDLPHALMMDLAQQAMEMSAADEMAPHIKVESNKRGQMMVEK